MGLLAIFTCDVKVRQPQSKFQGAFLTTSLIREMTEDLFSRTRRESWEEFERLVSTERRGDLNPDELADLFVELTDDLAYARTFFPGSDTERFLNQVTGRAHQALYRRRRESRDRFRRFWTYDVPVQLYNARKELLFSLILFAVAMLIGIVSTSNDPDFARSFFGDAYINTTLDNIANDDPMGIYGMSDQWSMFFRITFNNILVSLYAFILGALFGVGTFALLVKNGVMLGTFHTFLHQEGQLLTSLLAVYIHGTIEISSIVVAGAAGFAMGKGLLFPGTYSRSVAFRRGAIRGVTIVIGLLPFFVVAGFLESFVTRYYYISEALNGLIILLSLSLIVWYFILWPQRVAGKAGLRAVDRHDLEHDGSDPAVRSIQPT